MSSQSPPPNVVATTRKLSISSGVRKIAQKIILYGPGAVGKTTLASCLDDVGIMPLFVDIEEGSSQLDVARIDPTPETFEEMREAIQLAANSPDIGAIVIDSFTKAEELATAYTLRTIKHEKGEPITGIESYGWGKGYVHVYESFLLLLQSLDAAARKGKHIIGICHDVTEKVPNPNGEDWLQYQPRLQSPPKNGKTRERVREWSDHLLFVGFDAYVDKDGKAKGGGSRTIYTTARPMYWAKSRSLSESVVYEQGDAEIWKQLFKKE